MSPICVKPAVNVSLALTLRFGNSRDFRHIFALIAWREVDLFVLIYNHTTRFNPFVIIYF